jgi:hypothetical protein
MLTDRQKFCMQRISAKNRGINFDFSFEEWVDWWGKDMSLRGCKKGQLVMARKNDTGPYHPNNVYKQTCGENVADMRRRVRGNGK